MFTNFRRRRGLYRIVILLAIACIVILCFQFFLFGALNIYSDKQADIGRFDRGARPKYLNNGDVAGKLTVLQNIRRSTARQLDLPAVPHVMNYADCKDRKNCTRNINLFDEQQKHYANESALEANFAETGISPKLLLSRLHQNLEHKAIPTRWHNASSFASVWQYLDAVFPVSETNLADSNIKLRQLNETSVKGVNSRWHHLYHVAVNEHFICPLSQVFSAILLCCTVAFL